jgi:hypothetical protein
MDNSNTCMAALPETPFFPTIMVGEVCVCVCVGAHQVTEQS